MNRHDSQKILADASGLVALDHWVKTRTGFGCTHFVFSSNEKQLIKSISDTVIPSDQGVFTLPVEVDKFPDAQFEKYFGKDDQQNIKTWLNALKDTSRNSFSKSFSHKVIADKPGCQIGPGYYCGCVKEENYDV